VKGGKGTWYSVHKNEWGVDHPAMRADIEGLTLGFQLAMRVIDENQSLIEAGNKAHHHKGPVSGDDASALLSSLENDLLAVKAEVNKASLLFYIFISANALLASNGNQYRLPMS